MDYDDDTPESAPHPPRNDDVSVSVGEPSTQVTAKALLTDGASPPQVAVGASPPQVTVAEYPKEVASPRQVTVAASSQQATVVTVGALPNAKRFDIIIYNSCYYYECHVIYYANVFIIFKSTS